MAVPPARRCVVFAFSFKFTIKAPGFFHRSSRHCFLPKWCVWARLASVSIS